MSKFNTSSSHKTTNLAGGSAFSMNAKEELAHAVLATFLEDKHYETGDKRIERIAALVPKVPASFVAKLAVFARVRCNLRSVTTLLIAELAKVHRGDSLVKDTIIATAERPDDLTELVAYIGTPIPKQVKRGVRNALLKFNRYQLAKYKGEGKAVSLVDLFNLTHPKPQHADKEQKKAWKDLIEGKLTSFDTWETEISASKNPKKTWETLILEDKLGYMALLRNLNNFIKHDISKKAIATVIKKLTDRDEVEKSKQLPFRFITAYDNVTGNRELTDAISEAMDLSLDNTPKLKGKTLIAVDTSGSMEGDPIKKAAIFAATLFKSNNADLVQFSNTCTPLVASSRTPIIDIAKSIENQAQGGGTNTGSVFDTAKDDYARIIILSDNESWNGSAQSSYAEYRKKNDCMVYAIDIAGYGSTDLKSSKVKHLAGWSDKVLDLIPLMEKGKSLVEYIEKGE